MKSIVTQTLKLLMLCFAIGISHMAQAQNTVNYQVQSIPTNTGSIVEVPVTVSDFTNAVGLQFDLLYPTDKANFLGLTNAHPSLGGFGATSYLESNGTISVIWLEPTLTPISLNNNEQLFTIQLEITAAQGESLAIDIANTYAVDPVGDEISSTGTSGTVNVGALTFIVSDATVNAGATVDIPVTVQNFVNVAGFQYQIQFPADKATFVSIDNFNNGLTGFTDQHYFSPSAGVVNVVWDEPSLTNTSIDDDEVLFTIKLQITANPGDVFPIDIASIFAFDNVPEAKLASAISGTITVVEFGEITGTVYLEDGSTAVGLVDLTLAGAGTNQTVTNQNDGTYSFSAIPYGDYTLTPEKNINIVNGINVADVLLIRRHILGLTIFDSPYKLIAADADFSDAVNVADIITVRRLILQSQNTLAKSWRFVNTDHVFSDPANPFADAFENRTYTNLAGQQINQDFIGVKIGDVNNNNNPLQRTESIEVELAFASTKAFNGSTVKVPVVAKGNYTDIAGWQGTIQFDNKVLVFKGYESAGLTVRNQNFFTEDADQGTVTFLYDQAMARGENFSTDEVLFNLVFDVIGDAGSKGNIAINSDKVPTAVYTSEFVEGNYLRVDAGAVEVIEPEVTVYPNPSTAFNVDVLLPQATQVEMTFQDLVGRTVKTQVAEADKGRHTLALDATGLAKGVYILKVKMGSAVHTQQVIVQ